MLTLVAGVEPKKSHLNLNPRRGNDPQSPHAGWLLAVLLTHVGEIHIPPNTLYEKVSNLFCSRQFAARPTSNFRPFHT